MSETGLVSLGTYFESGSDLSEVSGLVMVLVELVPVLYKVAAHRGSSLMTSA